MAVRTAVRAAVVPAPGAPLEVTGIELPEPGPGRVRVRLAAAGVCHSDLSLSNGTMRVPLPAVLGHEGAGTVVAVGEGVTHVAPGDEVVLNWAPPAAPATPARSARCGCAPTRSPAPPTCTPAAPTTAPTCTPA